MWNKLVNLYSTLFKIGLIDIVDVYIYIGKKATHSDILIKS